MRLVRGIIVAAIVVGSSCACQSAEPSTKDIQVQFLSVVCSVNMTFDDLSSYVDPSKNSVAQFQSAAANVRDELRGAAESLDTPDAPWPANVEGDIAILKAAYLSDAGMFDSLSKAATWETVTSIFAQNTSTDTTERDAQQRIRFELDLPADSKAGCD